MTLRKIVGGIALCLAVLGFAHLARSGPQAGHSVGTLDSLQEQGASGGSTGSLPLVTLRAPDGSWVVLRSGQVLGSGRGNSSAWTQQGWEVVGGDAIGATDFGLFEKPTGAQVVQEYAWWTHGHFMLFVVMRGSDMTDKQWRDYKAKEYEANVADFPPDDPQPPPPPGWPK